MMRLTQDLYNKEFYSHYDGNMYNYARMYWCCLLPETHKDLKMFTHRQLVIFLNRTVK
jgi:hypothetical protein